MEDSRATYNWSERFAHHGARQARHFSRNAARFIAELDGIALVHERQLHSLNLHSGRICRKSFQIFEIRCENGPSGFRDRDDESVDSRASTSAPPQQRRATRQRLANFFDNVAGLEKSIGECIAPSMAFETFDKDGC